MAYILLEDFRRGMDRTRPRYAGVPGSLYELKNCHITRGGDIERRKKFVSAYTLPSNTLGLASIRGQLYVFGSVADPGVNKALVYQRCQHPDGSTTMSRVLDVKAFDGKPYVIAEYTDGSLYHFYDGARVTEWDDIAAAVSDTVAVASALASKVNAAAAVSAFSTNSVVTITAATPGTGFTLAVGTTNGGSDATQDLTITNVQANVAAAAETASTGTLDITGGAENVAATGSVELTGGSGGSVESITVDGTEILGVSVSFNVTLAQTASDVAAQINARTGDTGYSASTGGTATITISAAAEDGSTADGRAVSSLTVAIVSVDTNLSGGVTNTVATVTVDGADILDGAVLFDTDAAATATAVAAQITAGDSGYSASAVGATITLTAPDGLGASADGRVVSATATGTVTVGNFVNFSGGVDAIEAVAQIDQVTVSGIVEARDAFTITVDGTDYTVAGAAAGTGKALLVIKSKVNSITRSLRYFSAVNDADDWGQTEVSATGTITLTGGAAGSVDTILADGVDILGGAVAYNTSLNQTATDVAARINSNTNGTGYSASAGSAVITISAPVGDGFAANGRTLSATSTTITTSSTNFAGGISAGPGSGFLNLANQNEGSADLTALAEYQGKLAAFSRTAVQLWTVDEDPELDAFQTTIENTGTRSPRSVLAYGNTDVFYLSDGGVRSIRARDVSNAAYVNDVGTPIDPELGTYLSTLTDGEIERACSVLDPKDGRYWLVIGDRIYVFSYFPDNKISAWSYYEIDETGADISDIVRLRDQIYARAGDQIYVYGGAAGTTYPSANEAEAVVDMPFLTAKTDATFKGFEGYDVAGVGEWTVQFRVDPTDDTVIVGGDVVSEVTFSKSRQSMVGQYTHVAPKLTCSAAGAAALSMFALHYEDPNEQG